MAGVVVVVMAVVVVWRYEIEAADEVEVELGVVREVEGLWM